jgi:signal transduction histidine kinase
MEYNRAELISAVIYIFVAFFLMSLAILIFVFYSRKKIIEEEIKTKDLQIENQKELLNAVIETQEIERNRIAQDLHDDISSGLNVVSLNCHMLKSPGLTEAENEEIANNILLLTSKVLENSRRIAHDLLPPIIDKFGLDAGIKELAEDLNKTGKVSISYSNEIDIKSIDTGKHLHIFRILQELINNSMRHGKANQIKLLLKKENEKNCFQYEDNGVGFDLNDESVQKGLGMKNIESRVSYIGGEYTLQSEKGNGINVTIYF